MTTSTPRELAVELGYRDETRPGAVVRRYLRQRYPEHPKHERAHWPPRFVVTALNGWIGELRKTQRYLCESGCSRPRQSYDENSA